MRNYTRVRRLDPSALSKDDLTQLSRLLSSRVSNGTAKAENRFLVQTSDMLLSAETLEELLESDDLPPHLKTLTVASEVKEASPQELTRGVELKFAPTNLECTVSASDSHWVRGTFEEVQTFLRRKRPRTWFPRKYFGALILGALGFVIGFYVSGGSFLGWPYQLAQFTAFYAVLGMQYLHVNGKFFSYSDVALQENRRFLTLGMANFALAAIGTAVAVAGYLRES